MRKVYCDKCKKEIFSDGYYANAIKMYFYNKEGCKKEIVLEYCKKCYKEKVKQIGKEIIEM